MTVIRVPGKFHVLDTHPALVQRLQPNWQQAPKLAAISVNKLPNRAQNDVLSKHAIKYSTGSDIDNKGSGGDNLVLKLAAPPPPPRQMSHR